MDWRARRVKREGRTTDISQTAGKWLQETHKEVVWEVGGWREWTEKRKQILKVWKRNI